MEIERKFAVKRFPEGLENYPYAEMEQAYLSVDPIIRVRQDGDAFYLTYKGPGMLSREDVSHLAEQMKRVLPEKLKRYSRLIGVEYGRVTVRRQKSKWGSCSAKGNLNFNCLLMLAPEEVLDYVVVHELCHRKHMDHSKEFWAEVRRVKPDYEKGKKWLKDNGAVLMRRIREE